MPRILLIVLVLLMAGCAHKPEDFKADVTTAEQRCAIRQFDRASDKFNCFSVEETAVVNKDIPFAARSFSTFVDARAMAARIFDNDTENALLEYRQYSHDSAMYIALLGAKEPRLGQQQSQLSHDIVALNAKAICGNDAVGAEKWANCVIPLVRAVWGHDAQDSISYFDEWASNTLVISKKYDTTGAPTTISNAQQRFNVAENQAVRDFYDSAQRDEREEAAKEQADKAQAQAQAEERLKALGDFVGDLAELTLAGAVAYEAARAPAYAPTAQPSSPTSLRCTSNTIYSTTYTNCHAN